MSSLSLKEVGQEMALAGTAAMMIVNVTHPIDMYKTCLQVDAKFSLRNLMATEGISGLYRGVTAAWLRESTYTSMKLGLYGPVKKLYGADKDASFFIKFAAGSTAGVIGSFFGNPFDVMKTLMITKAGGRVGVREIGSKIYTERGISGFFRGLEANALRACVLNGTKMACYDQIKGYIVDFTGWKRSDLITQFSSAVGAGFCMACTVTPFDGLRTRLMNQPPSAKLYNGIMDCAVKTVQQEGFMALYRGFFPIWARFAPQATGQLVFFEFLRKIAGMDSL